MVFDQVGRLAGRKAANKLVDQDARNRYKTSHSLTEAQGSLDERDAGNPRSRLLPTSGRTPAAGMGAGLFARDAVSAISRSVPAGVGAGSGRCVASGGVGAGEAVRDGKRLAIAAAVKALLDDGISPQAIRAELGLTKPRYYRILDALGIPHSPALAGARRSRVELHDLGPDRPYSIQLTAGVPCRFSVHFEGSGFRVEALPVREEAQAVEL